jgi:hypothetical protein
MFTKCLLGCAMAAFLVDTAAAELTRWAGRSGT